MVHELLIAAVIILGWIGAVVVLHRRGLLAKANMVAVGPLLMWRTQRGRNLIEWLARPKRFWRVFGDLSIFFVAVTMVLITGLLVWQATLVLNIPPEVAPTPDLILGIPGVNRLIPIGYGIFGLAVAVLLHEFLHGVLARVSKTKIRSLGVLLFVVPIGAFVEPDEDEMRALPRRERARLYAVGPATNLLLAFVFALVFSVGFISSVQAAAPGVGVMGIVPDSPAANASLMQGMIITAVDGTPTPDHAEFERVMAGTTPGQVVEVSIFHRGSTEVRSVTLGPGPEPKGYLGLYADDIRTSAFNPFAAFVDGRDPTRAALVYISLPFFGLAPVTEPTTDLYIVAGPLGAIPPSVFWVLANTAYWLFWLNLMLGATNALPAVPLDGGYMFRDALEWFYGRFRRARDRAWIDRAVRTTSLTLAVFILMLIVWQFVGPRLPFR